MQPDLYLKVSKSTGLILGAFTEIPDDTAYQYESVSKIEFEYLNLIDDALPDGIGVHLNHLIVYRQGQVQKGKAKTGTTADVPSKTQQQARESLLQDIRKFRNK